jgi:hypothetical protein
VEGHIRRPPNAFVLYRRHLCAQLRSEGTTEGKGPDGSEISKRAGVLWNSLSEKEKATFKEQAAQVKKEHMRKYPDYRYAPTGRAAAVRRVRPNRLKKPTSVRTSTPEEAVVETVDKCHEVPQTRTVFPLLGVSEPETDQALGLLYQLATPESIYGPIMLPELPNFALRPIDTPLLRSPFVMSSTLSATWTPEVETPYSLLDSMPGIGGDWTIPVDEVNFVPQVAGCLFDLGHHGFNGSIPSPLSIDCLELPEVRIVILIPCSITNHAPQPSSSYFPEPFPYATGWTWDAIDAYFDFPLYYADAPHAAEDCT